MEQETQKSKKRCRMLKKMTWMEERTVCVRTLTTTFEKGSERCSILTLLKEVMKKNRLLSKTLRKCLLQKSMSKKK